MMKWIVGGIVLLAIIGAAGSTSEQPSSSATSSDTEEATAATTTTETEAAKKSSTAPKCVEADDDCIPRLGVGRTVKVDGVRYKIISARTAKKVGNEFLNERADGIFVIARIAATNDRKESSTLTDSAFSIEANGKKYTPDSEGTTTYLLSRGGDQTEDPFFLRDIQPDTTTKGFVVFDVPEKVAFSSKLAMRFNELGFGSKHGYLRMPAL